MARERDELAIHEKLARCRQLAREFISEPTATHLRELEAELLAQLRRLKEQGGRPSCGLF
jgi:hypothetical protein